VREVGEAESGTQPRAAVPALSATHIPRSPHTTPGAPPALPWPS